MEVTDNDGATDTDVVRITVQSSNGNSLAISDVAALCPTDQNVTIKWVTDQPASGKVEYGTDTNYGEVSSLDPNLSKNHCIVLTWLSPSTTYHFRVISQDSTGNTGISDDYTFTTLPDQSGGSTCIWIEAENGIINSPMQIEAQPSSLPIFSWPVRGGIVAPGVLMKKERATDMTREETLKYWQGIIFLLLTRRY